MTIASLLVLAACVTRVSQAAPAPAPAAAAVRTNLTSSVSFAEAVVAGAGARIFAQTLLHPLEVVRTRTQVSTTARCLVKYYIVHA